MLPSKTVSHVYVNYEFYSAMVGTISSLLGLETLIWAAAAEIGLILGEQIVAAFSIFGLLWYDRNNRVFQS